MEESFKKPILPALPPTTEEKLLEVKKIESECPYHVPVSILIYLINLINC